MSEAFDLLAALVLEDGRRWGEAAVDVQWEDARAVLDQSSPTPYHWLGRARGYSKTSDLGGMGIKVLLAQAPSRARLYGIAADQAQGTLLVDAIGGFASRTPELQGALQIQEPKTERLPATGPPNGSCSQRDREVLTAARHAAAVSCSEGWLHRAGRVAHAGVVSRARIGGDREEGSLRSATHFRDRGSCSRGFDLRACATMGTSVRMIDRTYGHLARDSDDAIRAKLDARASRPGGEVASKPGAGSGQ